MKGKNISQRRNKRGVLLWMAVAACLILAGCASFGSISLNKAVNKYDEAVLQSEQQVLLRNIIRMHDDQPLHLTEASSISATFTLSGTGGLTPSFTGSTPASDNYATSTFGTGLSLGSTISESPLITISPMHGKDYVERLLKPVDERFINMLLMQRSEPKLDKMLRLIGKNFYLMGPESTQEIFDKLEDLPPTDFEGRPLKNSQGEIVIHYDYPFLNTNTASSSLDLKKEWHKFKASQDDNEKELKALRDLKDKEEKLQAFKNDNEEELEDLKEREKELKALKANEEELKALKVKEDELEAFKKYIKEELKTLKDEEQKKNPKLAIVKNKNDFHNLIVNAKRDELIKDKSFTPKEADCILDTSDGCYMENKPQITQEGETIRKDISHYALFRKLVLHIQAMALTGRLQYSYLDFSVPVEGTLRHAKDLSTKDFKDIIDAFEKQYFLEKTEKEQEKEGFMLTDTSNRQIEDTFMAADDLKGKDMKNIFAALDRQYIWTKMHKVPEKDEIYTLTKHYPVTVLADFDFEKMKDKYKKELLDKIKEDIEFEQSLMFDEGLIVVLFRGDPVIHKDTPDYSSSWPIYGLFRLRNFRQVLQFLEESVEDGPGYAKEYYIAPSELTEEMLCKGTPQLGSLDNPALTLTINSDSEMTPPSSKYRLVDVDYNGKFWISSSRGQIGAPSQPISCDNPHPARWDGEVFSMLYEIFQFNRIDPAVSTPSISIAK
ncbi:MAG: hypothetical protein ABSC11_12420 [Smithella sp.]|jgi:hypothetical protein